VAKNKPPRIPAYRKQKRPNSADEDFVEIQGQRFYVGCYGTPESRQAYERLIAQYLANE
jgi:hypothetical protein